MFPGAPRCFATAQPLPGGAVGLLVESHMGRPTKIEGNPEHPASRGATSLYHQASILTLYDPDRSQTVTYQGRTRTRKRGESHFACGARKRTPKRRRRRAHSQRADHVAIARAPAGAFPEVTPQGQMARLRVALAGRASRSDATGVRAGIGLPLRLR